MTLGVGEAVRGVKLGVTGDSIRILVDGFIKKAKKIRAGRLLLPVISIDQLIKMKQVAGRPIDQMDIHDLKRMKALKKWKK